jgi:hypothetical protein
MSLDRLVKYFNDHVENITVMYSTPGIYLDAIKKQNLSYPVKYDDMFPYSDEDNDFWSGFFTSRANSKGQARDGQRNFLAAEKVFAMNVLDAGINDVTINQTLAA